MKLTSRSAILLTTAGGLLVALSGLGIAQSSGGTPADSKFAREAAAGGMEEVELGKVAVRNASDDKVKAFGQRMVDDHSKAGDELKTIASKDNINLPAGLDAKGKATVERLSALSGSVFDRAYMMDMVKDHQADIAAFQRESSSGMNPDLKMWATTTLPTLQDHLRMAKDAEGAVGKH